MIDKYLKRNRSHYLKWNLNDDLSVRYYFLYENKRFQQYQNQFVLKSHINKTYQIITEEDLSSLISEYNISSIPEEYFSLSGDNYEYIRLCVNEKSEPTLLTLEEEF